MLTYTINYYEGEEREVNVKDVVFSSPDECLQFIYDNGLHPDYMCITEHDGEEYVDTLSALYYID